MDLLQALIYSSAVIYFLLIRETDSVPKWFLLGVLVGACCLARATTPVYIVGVFTIFFVADLFTARKTSYRIFLAYMAAAVACAITAGWFFALNYDYLRFYYLVWNTDANAKLP